MSKLYGLTDRQGAGRWREAGFAAERARSLLLADRSLIPGEAGAFDTECFDAEAVVRWVEAGFSAREARCWTDVDVLPSEARVWRSVGLRPEDARQQRTAGGGVLPEGVEIGWFSYDLRREDQNYGATDPPGTRGAIADEHRQMIDPFGEG